MVPSTSRSVSYTHLDVSKRQGEKNSMNDRENDTIRENEGRQVQQELENQLRAFGDTVSDAFAHGFEGKGCLLYTSCRAGRR